MTWMRSDSLTRNSSSPLVTVRLEPGSGARLEFQMARYANRPTLAQPWNRGWLWKQ